MKQSPDLQRVLNLFQELKTLGFTENSMESLGPVSELLAFLDYREERRRAERNARRIKRRHGGAYVG